MIPKQSFVPLNKTLHDRSSFDCGENELNNFLQTRALKHMKMGISKTMVLSNNLSSSETIIPIRSFYTLAATSIDPHKFPGEIAKKLPYYPTPVFSIAQLAVSKDYHRHKLGTLTLVQALKHLLRINQEMPAFGVIVDCLNENLEAFYTHFGFKVLYQHNARIRMFLPMKTLEQLLSHE